MTTDAVSRLADLLLAAANEGRTLDTLDPALVPADDAAAYRVQATVMERRGVRSIGRKIGFGPDGRVTGAPMAAPGLVGSGETWTARGPSVGVELEIAVRMARDLPARPDRPYTAEEVFAAVDTILVAIEIVVRRFTDPSKVPYLAVLADSISHGGFVAGPGIPGARFRDVAVTGEFVADGRSLLKAPLAHPNADWLVPLLAHASSPPAGLGHLRAGEIVTTGSLCGLIPVDVPSNVTGTINGLGTVSVVLTRA
jgi:2-keto-4-pentenoate hydratase